MADLEFEVAKRNTKPITFTLGDDDHVFKFTPPKNAVMMMPILDRNEDKDDGIELTKSTFDWLGEGLSEEDNKIIIDRLKDPEDDLDTDILNKIIEGLSEKVGRRPTT